MKKILAGVVMIFSLLPVLAFAQVGDVNPNPTTSCASITHNLAYGSRDSQTGGDVSNLQFFLQSKSYLNSDPTGYFGLLTEAAVKSFQSASGVLNSGYVGPITRGKISTICGTSSTTPTTTPVSISVPPFIPTVCPVGALFNSATGAPCTTTTTPTSGCPAGALFNIMTGASCGTTPNFPSTTTPVTTSGSFSFNLSPSTINSGQAVSFNWILPPNITSPKIYLSCGPNVASSYDGTNICGQWQNVTLASPASISVTFTNTGSVASPVSTTFNYLDQNGVGQSYPQATITVNPASAPVSTPTQSSITVGSLSGGVATQGTSINVTWTSQGTIGSQVQIGFCPAGQQPTGVTSGPQCTEGAVYPNTGSASVSLTGALGLFPGQWETYVMSASNQSIFGMSPSYTVVSATAAATPSVTLTAPTANATLQQGQTVTFVWEQTGLSEITIQLLYPDGDAYEVVGNYPVSGTEGAYPWVVPSSIPAGSGYKIFAGYGSNSDIVGPITIASSASTPTPTPTPSPSQPFSFNFSPATVTSGQSVSFNWTLPSNITSPQIMLSCQSGITATYSGNNICGQWQSVSLGSTGISVTFSNTGSTALVYPTFNYKDQNGVGQSTSPGAITVQGN